MTGLRGLIDFFSIIFQPIVIGGIQESFLIDSS